MFHFGTSLLAVREQVRRQPDRALGRVDEVPARDVLLEDVVLRGAAEAFSGHALLLADELVQEQQHARGSVDRHRRRDLVERDPLERDAHVVDRVDRDPGPPDLAEAPRIVGIEPELGREVERHRQPRRSVLEQVVVALVRLLRARVPRVLPHRPQLLAVHLAVDAAGERILAGLAEALGQRLGKVVLVVALLDLDPGVREPPRIVGTDDRRDRAVLVGGGHSGQVTRGPTEGRGLPPRTLTDPFQARSAARRRPSRSGVGFRPFSGSLVGAWADRAA